MRITLIFLLASISLFGQSTKISDMTSATSLTGAELVPIVQTTNKKSTVTLLRGWSTLGTAGQYLRVNAGATGLEFLTPAFVSGSTGSTDNAILRADGTGGSTVQSSAVTIDDTGNVTLGILGSTAGASRIIQPEGSASDIGLIFTPKGVGNFSSTANRVVFLASSDISLTGDYTSINNNTSSLAGELRIYEPSTSGTNYNAFKTAAQSVDVTYTLPLSAPTTDGESLVATTAGVWSWEKRTITKQVLITSAQILSSNSSPVEIIAAPGAGKCIQVISMMMLLDYNSIAYATNTDAQLKIGSQNYMTTGSLLAVTTDTASQTNDITLSAVPINQSMVFTTVTGNPTAGNSDLYVSVTYRIVP